MTVGSRVSTADVPTSVCSVQTVWATNSHDTTMERGDSHEGDGVLRFAAQQRG
jgi:hypothetical protein